MINSKNELQTFIEESLEIDLSIDYVIATLEKFSSKLLESDFDEELKSEISKFCSKDEIENKIIQELGCLEAFELKKRDFKTSPMEAFYPLGIVLHITPSNSPGLAFLAMIESLLGLNTNIVKISRRDTDETFRLCEILFSCDVEKKISKKTFITQGSLFSLEDLVELSDAVSCWGGDEAITNIRNSVPVSKRFITWGHKISFSLLSKVVPFSLSADKLATDIIKYDQLACSAPQVCYIVDASFEELKEFSRELGSRLEKLSTEKKLDELDIQEQAELTNIKELLKLESVIENKDILESPTNNWRIYIEQDSSFKASPLKRSIWLKSIKGSDLVKTLRPHRSHLQTVGVSLSKNDLNIVPTLYKAGALRVRELGTMQDSYSGEPHDGEQALRRFVKRISLETDSCKNNYRFDENTSFESKGNSLPIMTKEDFQNITPNSDLAHLFFRSGGSSGKTAISPFSYHAYHRQMQAAAEGLWGAGLNPITDRVANLFFGGGLYGGFLSFYTILEKLEVVQYPLAAYEDKEFVAKVLAEGDINTIVGMPSYIIELYQSHGDLLKSSKIKKIYFGGEHFGKKQREWLESEFNISVIRSASYGSVDAGPLGFQCEYLEGGQHHLNESIQDLEILKIDKDEPAEIGEVGRLVFTSKARDCISIERYDLGDLGAWIEGDCPCGRSNRRFELLGRHGDIFRAAGSFLNFIRIQKILIDQFDYCDSSQVVISRNGNKDKLTLIVSNDNITTDKVLSSYQDLNEAVVKEESLLFNIECRNQKDMEHSSNSGKLLRVIDKREL